MRQLSCRSVSCLGGLQASHFLCLGSSQGICKMASHQCFFGHALKDGNQSIYLGSTGVIDRNLLKKKEKMSG